MHMFDIGKSIKAFVSDKAKLKKLLLIGGPVIAAAVCIVLVVTLQNPAAVTGEAIPSDGEAISNEEPYEEKDLFSNAIATGEYAGTILEKTRDAGIQYVKDTLFIGDSNTAGMINNSNTTNISMNNGIGIVSMGISHVLTLNCVQFQGMPAITIPEAVKILQPRRVVITFGTNDYYMKPDKFAETYGKAIDAIKKAYPQTDIIIGSIFPITSNCSYFTVSMPTIEKFNLELIKLAQEKNLQFLNWSEVLKDPKTGYCQPAYMAGDGVHLSKKGLEQISEYFRTHMLDTEDLRPKPLNPIPQRLPNPPGLLGVGVGGDDKKEEEPAVVVGPVTVTFVASSGGLVNGQAAVTFEALPGATVGPVSATPLTGYNFVKWSGGGPSFTVPANATAGQSFVITAIFEKPGGNITDPGTGDPDPEDPPPGPGPGTEDPPPGPGPGTEDPGGGSGGTEDTNT